MQDIRVTPERMEPCRAGVTISPLILKKHVHGAHFFDVLALDTVQPENLSVVLLLGLVLGLQGSRVVPAVLV